MSPLACRLTIDAVIAEPYVGMTVVAISPARLTRFTKPRLVVREPVIRSVGLARESFVHVFRILIMPSSGIPVVDPKLKPLEIPAGRIGVMIGWLTMILLVSTE